MGYPYGMPVLKSRPKTSVDAARAGAPQRYRFTPDVFHQLGALGVFPADARLELIEGDIYAMPPEGPDHATTRLRTTRQFARRESSRWHVRIEAPLRLGDSEPVPDISIVEGDLENYAHAHPTGAFLVIEIADASVEYDQTVKARLYAQAGIPEYWIVNLKTRRLEVYRDPTPQGYQTVQHYTADETVRPLFEPEWEIRVGDFLQ